MSPTVFHQQGFRFFFFSREESRMHVHVHSGRGEAKCWIEPEVLLARNHGLSERELKLAQGIVEERKDDIVGHWRKHFGLRGWSVKYLTTRVLAVGSREGVFPCLRRLPLVS
ncbi:MAG TPA: DUF4160 domain-containing protein [Anaerolineae bacterium]|nr:DUF4160 domain-containing protein [Anaerolineae bacterium]